MRLLLRIGAALELISRAASSVEVMYRSHGPNTGSNPKEGRYKKKKKKQSSQQKTNEKSDQFIFQEKLLECMAETTDTSLQSLEHDGVRSLTCFTILQSDLFVYQTV